MKALAREHPCGGASPEHAEQALGSQERAEAAHLKGVAAGAGMHSAP